MFSNTTTIRAKKDLYNQGKCFTKDNTYEVGKVVINEAGLMEAKTINDLGQTHIIGGWWRDFDIVREDEENED